MVLIERRLPRWTWNRISPGEPRGRPGESRSAFNRVVRPEFSAGEHDTLHSVQRLFRSVRGRSSPHCSPEGLGRTIVRSFDVRGEQATRQFSALPVIGDALAAPPLPGAGFVTARTHRQVFPGGAFHCIFLDSVGGEPVPSHGGSGCPISNGAGMSSSRIVYSSFALPGPSRRVSSHAPFAAYRNRLVRGRRRSRPNDRGVIFTPGGA